MINLRSGGGGTVGALTAASEVATILASPAEPPKGQTPSLTDETFLRPNGRELHQLVGPSKVALFYKPLRHYYFELLGAVRDWSNDKKIQRCYEGLDLRHGLAKVMFSVPEEGVQVNLRVTYRPEIADVRRGELQVSVFLYHKDKQFHRQSLSAEELAPATLLDYVSGQNRARLRRE